MAPVRLLPSYFCFIARTIKPLGFVTSNWPGCGQHRLQVDGSRRGYDDKFWSDLQICRTQTRTCTARASKAPAYNNQNIVTYLHNQNYLQQHVGLGMTVIWTACYWNFTAVCLSVCLCWIFYCLAISQACHAGCYYDKEHTQKYTNYITINNIEHTQNYTNYITINNTKHIQNYTKYITINSIEHTQKYTNYITINNT